MIKKPLKLNSAIIISAVFLTLFYNITFFSNVLSLYPFTQNNVIFILSVAVFLCSLTAFLLGLVCYKSSFKLVLILIFPTAALASYFMSSYNIVIDTTMVANILATDAGETMDLLTLRMLLYFVVLGIFPGFVICRINIAYAPFKAELFAKLKLLLGSLAMILVMISLASGHYTTFFREHKILRYYTNPVTFIYSTGKYLAERANHPSREARIPLGENAKIPDTDIDRELIVLVVGETARADRFSLNGYQRKTNPELGKYELISFSEMYSCGTSTAMSLPCMFALEEAADFELAESAGIENLLDVLTHADVNVLWRDNNSDSKGVAVSVHYEDFRNPNVNPVCDVECRDVGMLEGLDDYIDANPEGDIVIVLHQMGNHGPAYYRRYPAEFETFTPVCRTSQLEECSQEEIDNAYDNAIVYTDFFLSQVIEFLQSYDDEFETAMFYVSDHGESLGEYGLYLHGLPVFVAPDVQMHVPSILWFGENYDVELGSVESKAKNYLTHDNYFHTVLGMFEIESELYDESMDIILGAGL